MRYDDDLLSKAELAERRQEQHDAAEAQALAREELEHITIDVPDQSAYRLPMPQWRRYMVQRWRNLRRNRWTKPIVIGTGALAVIAAALLLVRIITRSPSTEVDPPVQAQVEVIQEDGYTTLQWVRERFDPWRIRVDENDPSRNIAMLMESGSVEIGSHTVDFDPLDWSSDRPFAVRTFDVQGTFVIVTTSQGKTFKIPVGQAFVLAQTPDRIHIVTEDGTLWTAQINQVKDQ